MLGNVELKISIMKLFSVFSVRKDIRGIITPKLKISKHEPIRIRKIINIIFDFLKSEIMLSIVFNIYIKIINLT
tara:strand:+ start:74 stop:295 length:222 start_codon:yes stop_codon:yes gene_type:complete